MPHLKRALALGVLMALLLPAADAPKPKVRAITAFITTGLGRRKFEWFSAARFRLS